jgi:hypothetical protein
VKRKNIKRGARLYFNDSYEHDSDVSSTPEAFEPKQNETVNKVYNPYKALDW